MKGLTPAELDILLYANTEPPFCRCDGTRRPCTPAEEETIDNLVLQQRLRSSFCECHGIRKRNITPAGREALRLWLLVKAAMEGSR